MILIVVVMLCFTVAAVAFLAMDQRAASIVAAAAGLTLIAVLQHFAGISALPDGRLATEPWRALAVTTLEDDLFLLSVRYAGGDIRTYRLQLSSPEARDEMLKAEQGAKKGKTMTGRAHRGRAGLADDSDMGFEFFEAPESDPKNASR